MTQATQIIEKLERKHSARLIPTASKSEERATSVLLAAFEAVPEFAKSLLDDAGVSLGSAKTIKVTCFTEVTFKRDKKSAAKESQPDGLIVIERGKNVWTALVESKIWNNNLTNDQVEEYLELVKKHEIDALITISNQLAVSPVQHPLKTAIDPVKIPKVKGKLIDLYHFSWGSLRGKAERLTGEEGIENPEKQYILNELIRFFDDYNAGVDSFTNMPNAWKDFCSEVQNSETLNSDLECVTETVSAWHQLLKRLCLDLGSIINQEVTIYLNQKEKRDSFLRFSTDCKNLSKDFKLNAEFNIPNAAAYLNLSVDVRSRVLNISMVLKAPQDKITGEAAIKWLFKQLESHEHDDLFIRSYWKKKSTKPTKPLDEVIDDPKAIIPDTVDRNELPTYLEFVRIVNINNKFGPKNFIKEIATQFISFYTDVGQHLEPAKPPKPPQVIVVEQEELSETNEVAPSPTADVDLDTENEG